MVETYPLVMSDDGCVTIPDELRERFGLTSGCPIVLVETARGVLLLRRDQAQALVRQQLHGVDLVAELLAEHRQAAAAEDSL